MAFATHILIPTDFSDASHLAIDAGGMLATQLGAKVTLVHVHDPDALHPPATIGWQVIICRIWALSPLYVDGQLLLRKVYIIIIDLTQQYVTIHSMIRSLRANMMGCQLPFKGSGIASMGENSRLSR